MQASSPLFPHFRESSYQIEFVNYFSITLNWRALQYYLHNRKSSFLLSKVFKCSGVLPVWGLFFLPRSPDALLSDFAHYINIIENLPYQSKNLRCPENQRKQFNLSWSFSRSKRPKGQKDVQIPSHGDQAGASGVTKRWYPQFTDTRTYTHGITHTDKTCTVKF